jgi:hypothetical protein
MLHRALIAKTESARPFRVACSCGTAGEFDSEESAANWMLHQHFDRLGGISVCELSSTIPAEPEPAPEPEPVPVPAPAPEPEPEAPPETLGAA